METLTSIEIVDVAITTTSTGLTYDLVTATSGASLLVPRQGHQALSLLNGTVLIRGGDGADGHAVASEELYDPRADTVTAATPGTGVRGSCAAAPGPAASR